MTRAASLHNIAPIRRQVMIVEDDPSVLEVASLALEDMGLEVIPLSNADDALRTLVAQSADISFVMTDIGLPGELNGMELAGLVRKIWPDIPVMVTSGLVAAGAREIPADSRFLAKPWSIEQLRDEASLIMERQVL